MSDIRPDLLDNGIFEMPGRQKREKGRDPAYLYEGGELPADNPKTLALNISGSYTDDEDAAVAKRVESGKGKVRYFIKFSSSGSDMGHMCDPHGMYFEKRHLTQSTNRRGGNKYEFKEVNMSTFRDYVNYLTSKNATYLRSAERQVIDG